MDIVGDGANHSGLPTSVLKNVQAYHHGEATRTCDREVDSERLRSAVRPRSYKFDDREFHSARSKSLCYKRFVSQRYQIRQCTNALNHSLEVSSTSSSGQRTLPSIEILLVLNSPVEEQ